MEESLKTVNLVHQALVALSVALIAFSPSSDPRTKYQAALIQLTALRKLPLSDFDNYAHRLVIGKDRQLVQKYKSILSQIPGVSVSDEFTVNQPIYLKRPKEDAFMEDFISFFDGDNKIAYAQLDDASASKEVFEKAISSPSTCTILSDYKLQLMTLDLDQTAGSTDLRPWSNPEAGTSNVILQFGKKTGIGSNVFCARSADIRSSPVVIPGNQAMEWLRSTNPSYDVETLADLRRVIVEVAAKTPAEATKFLEDQVNTPAPPLEFVGIKVQQHSAVLVGPLATLAILLFFLANVRHLRLIYDGTDKVLKTFPWIGLFPDRLSKSMTYASVVLLPSLSNIRLLIRSARWTDPPTAAGWIITFGVAAVSLLIATEIHRLRSPLVHKPQNQKSPERHHTDANR